MRVFLYIFFLTLVLSLDESIAAPSVRGKTPSSPLTPLELETLETDAKPGSLRLTTALGYSIGNHLEANEQKSGFYLALNLQEKEPQTLELDLWINDKSLVGIFPGIRYPYSDDSVQKTYIKFSTGMYLSPDEGFTNFISIRRLQFRAAFGAENFLDYDNQLKVEGGLAYALIGLEAYAHLGWNWTF